jgi:hypothetical protein
MSQIHYQKFDSVMYEYCFSLSERAYKLIEDEDIDNGLAYLAHLADVLELLKDNRTPQETANITSFCAGVYEFDELDKDAVFTHLQENGYGQYIPER